MKLPSINRKVLSIDFGSSEIKVVEGKISKKGINITQTLTIKTPQGTYEDGEILDQSVIANIIKNTLKVKKVSTNIAYGIINSSSIITREIIIPKVSEKEISLVISYQLNDYLPVDPNDYVINHIVLGTNNEGNLEKFIILLVGVPKNMVLGHLNLMKAAGLKPQVLDFQGNAMAKLFCINTLVNNQYNTRDVAIASVDIGYINSKLTIIRNGTIEVSRIIDMGAKVLYESIGLLFDCSLEDIEQKTFDIRDLNTIQEEFTDYQRLVNITRTTIQNLLENIEIVFNYYTSREDENEINYILLQGGLSNLNGIDNMFSNYFNIPSIQINNLDKIKWNGDLSKYSNAIGGFIRIEEVKK